MGSGENPGKEGGTLFIMREGAKNEGKNWGYKHVGEEAPRDPGVGAHDNLTGLLG